MQDQSNPYDPPATSSPRARRSAMTARLVKAFGIVTLVGFLVWALGFIYGVFFVGIPYSDAPPDLLQRQEVHLNVSEYIAIAGVLVFVPGLLGFAGSSVVYLVLRAVADGHRTSQVSKPPTHRA